MQVAVRVERTMQQAACAWLAAEDRCECIRLAHAACALGISVANPSRTAILNVPFSTSRLITRAVLVDVASQQGIDC
eukprot:170750-Amphidinium_carterae.1